MASTQPNPEVDSFFTNGCGRCPLVNTPQCKVHLWDEELLLLRKIVLDCGLSEQLKWSMPCYTLQKNNVAMIAAFKDNCVLSFFKGSLLQDNQAILSKPGENSQAARFIRFTNVEQIIELEPVIRAYITEAIAIEQAGLKVEFKKTTDYAIPEELQCKLDELPTFKTAFEALTPGRQRAYILFFSQPKQAKTRESRVEKCIPQILAGKGLND